MQHILKPALNLCVLFKDALPYNLPVCQPARECIALKSGARSCYALQEPVHDSRRSLAGGLLRVCAEGWA